MKLVDAFGVVNAVLAAAVANAATVDVAYPAGFSQNSFNASLAGANSYVIINRNDKWTLAAGKIALSFGASAITITNNSGVTWAAGSDLMLGVDQVDGDVEVVNIPVKLVAISGNIDVVTDLRLGMEGTLESADVLVTSPVTTAAKLATLTPWIDGVAVTGGAVALTSANATPLGKVVAGSAITANNALTKASKLSLKATGVTAFSEGEGVVVLRVRKALPNAY